MSELRSNWVKTLRGRHSFTFQNGSTLVEIKHGLANSGEHVEMDEIYEALQEAQALGLWKPKGSK